MARTHLSGGVHDPAGYAMKGVNLMSVGATFKVGVYYGPHSTQAEGFGGISPNGFTEFVGFFVGKQQNFDRVQIYVNVLATDATEVMRLGIYKDDATGQPGALLADFGTVPMGTQAGSNPASSREIVIALTLPPGLYWLCAACQGLTGTGATMTMCGSVGIPVIGYTLPANLHNNGYYAAGVSGPLPAQAPALTPTNNNMPIICLRAAA